MCNPKNKKTKEYIEPIVVVIVFWGILIPSIILFKLIYIILIFLSLIIILPLFSKYIKKYDGKREREQEREEKRNRSARIYFHNLGRPF